MGQKAVEVLAQPIRMHIEPVGVELKEMHGIDQRKRIGEAERREAQKE
jgi:hypothetical protein